MTARADTDSQASRIFSPSAGDIGEIGTRSSGCAVALSSGKHWYFSSGNVDTTILTLGGSSRGSQTRRRPSCVSLSWSRASRRTITGLWGWASASRSGKALTSFSYVMGMLVSSPPNDRVSSRLRLSSRDRASDAPSAAPMKRSTITAWG